MNDTDRGGMTVSSLLGIGLTVSVVIPVIAIIVLGILIKGVTDQTVVVYMVGVFALIVLLGVLLVNYFVRRRILDRVQGLVDVCRKYATGDHTVRASVIGDDEFFEPLRDRRAVTRLEVEQDFVFEHVNVQVALHFALGVDQRGVTAFANFQILHVVGDLAVEKFLSIRPREAKARAEAQIQKTCHLTQRGVLGRRVSVMLDGLHPVDFGEAGVQAVVKFV